MKKILIVLILCLLTGCSNASSGFEEYHKSLEYLYNGTNYTIKEIDNNEETLTIYANGMCYIKDKETEVYLYEEDLKAYALVYNEENNIFVRQEIDYDEHLFYPYEMIERLNKLSAYINMGNLKYKKNIFIGEEFNGTYEYKEKLHTPINIKVELKDNRISHLYEKYINDNKEYESNIYISDYGTSRINLPLNVINLDGLDIEESE